MRQFNIMEGSEYIELSAPLKIYYDITNTCYLNCEFCFNKRLEKSFEEPTFQDICSVLDKISNAHVPDVAFIGGEPFASPHLKKAVIHAIGMGLNVGIITNGTLITEENAEWLKKLNVALSISIHAPNDELHDIISRGKNVDSSIINGLICLNNNGITPEIAFTPTKKSVQYLYETISGVLERGIMISDVLVNRLIPSGNAVENWEEIALTLSDQILLLEQIVQLKEKYTDLKIATGDAIPFCMVDAKYEQFIVRCDYGVTLGWINGDGRFGKCMCRDSDGFDSILCAGLRKLWKTSTTFTDHRKLVNVPEDCKICDWLELCGGGCACSSPDKSCKIDAYFDKNLMRKMPERKPDNKVFEKATVKPTDKYIFKHAFIIRNEKNNNLDDNRLEKYLLIPKSSKAIIQDLILPENGVMIWINNTEKQIILYINGKNTVFDIAQCISYELDFPIKNALKMTSETISDLIDIHMIEKI